MCVCLCACVYIYLQLSKHTIAYIYRDCLSPLSICVSQLYRCID